MRETINRELLKHHVCMAMFCPRCGTILDIARAVSLDVTVIQPAREKSYIMCAKCWDKEIPTINRLVAESNGNTTIQVTDGRQIFGRRKR